MYGIKSGGFSNVLNNFYGAQNYATVRKNTTDEKAAGLTDTAKKQEGEGKTKANTEEKKDQTANSALKKQVENLAATLTEKEKTNANNGNNKNVGNAKDKDKNATNNAADGEVVTAETPDQTAANKSLTDQLNAITAKFMDQLLKSMGIGEMKDGGRGANISAQSISMQYSLNISAMMTTMNADGSMTSHSMDFSFSMSMDYLGVSSGKGMGFDPFSLIGKNDKSADATENDPLAKLKEMFTPEATAQRILDFALSFYPKSKMFNEAGGDTENARNSFADYIGKAVQKGFDQALNILGKGLPQSVRDEVDQTHKLVFDGFDNFRKNGLSDLLGGNGTNSSNSAKNNLYQQLQYFSSSWEMNYSSTSIYYSPEETAQKLRNFGNANNPYAQLTPNNATNTPAAEKAQEVEAVNVTA